MNPQAQELNELLEKENPVVFNALSKRGKEIFFPKKGILGQSAEAKGKQINATIGIAVEDDGSPMRLPSIEKNLSLKPEEIFPYAPSFGKQDLRLAWKEQMMKKNPSLKEPISLPVITNALTHGLSMAGYLFIDENDHIIVPDPFWGNYRLIFEVTYGAKIAPFPSFHNKAFNLQGLDNALEDDGKKIVLFSCPNNPSGYTPTRQEAKKMVEIIKKHAEKKPIILIIDDAYFGLVYKEGIETESFFAPLAHAHKNIIAIKIDGATKEQFAWGLRVGFITFANKDMTKQGLGALEAKAAGAVRGTISNASNLSESLVQKAITSPTFEQEHNEKYGILKRRFLKVEEVLRDKKFDDVLEPFPFNSGYFMCVRLKGGIDAEKVRKELLEKHDTGVIAIQDYIRVAFSSVPEKDIKRLFDNIYNAAVRCKNG
ncbi:aminotransferase class I/II-fold pyridoxal phosphate-dependent enzyme [Candidatus Woesearchaeota archaeon]|nr:aminotransferase class I/II-fold pyridoxal phosphate-dependent enzyme [Candidatus Woesearchaeota archaeon]HIH37593.1 aminotransferase class I/II-fold pyridoxal phosphate-dependent enzyme [Candidatus Woesearchaeota archaeon]HIH48713.1 aminotransferase class I/II-fold pyridoxal phosphate-dependent enzyme [Candidatus Woesearchaeota archaeon]